ncbi:hypothetical protein SLEP1_g11915 [Rubroshorea leprosula]|nr:hypothetical protein SLEP1_g11915 [Rubroshorea leprosula]
MAQNKLFFAVFIFLSLIFILEIQSVEGRHLKFHSEKLKTYKRFFAKETEETAKVVESRSSLHAADKIKAVNADVQSPPAAPLTPGAMAGASQAPPPRHVDNFRPTAPGHSPGIGHGIHD